MTTESKTQENGAQILKKLRKVTAQFNGATSSRERGAAAAAIELLYGKLHNGSIEGPLLWTFSAPDMWARKLLVALCAHHGLTCYRRPRQRKTTVIVQVDAEFLHKVLYPQFSLLYRQLLDNFNRVTKVLMAEIRHLPTD